MENVGGDELFESWWDNLDPLTDLPPSGWPMPDPGTREGINHRNAGKSHQRHFSDAETALHPLVPPSLQHYTVPGPEFSPLDDVLESPHVDSALATPSGSDTVAAIPPAEPAFIPVKNPRAVPAFPISETIPEVPFGVSDLDWPKVTPSEPLPVAAAPKHPPATPVQGRPVGSTATPQAVTTPSTAGSGRRKKDTPRRRISGPQAELLESHFQIDSRPDKETREDLSRRSGVEFKSVTIWFQNRRAKDRNRMLQQSSHESLLNLYSTRDNVSSTLPSRHLESSPTREAALSAVANAAGMKNFTECDSMSSPLPFYSHQGTPVSRAPSRASWSPPQDWGGSPSTPLPKIPQLSPTPSSSSQVTRLQGFGRSRSTFTLPVVPRDQYEVTPKRRRSEFNINLGGPMNSAPSPTPPMTPRSRLSMVPGVPASPAPTVAAAAAEHLRTRHRSLTQPVGRFRPRLELAEENHSATLVMHPVHEGRVERGNIPNWLSHSPTRLSPSPTRSPPKY